MARIELDSADFERLQKAINGYSGIAEKAINEVFHNEGSQMLQKEILHLMPKSNVKEWKGKLPHAKDSKSLADEKGNLSITIKTSKKYQYLYFPDDGTNTRRHVGEQGFFRRGGEAKQAEIIDLCINRLVNGFEQ